MTFQDISITSVPISPGYIHFFSRCTTVMSHLLKKKKKKVAKTRTRASKTRHVWNWNIKIQTTVTLNARTKVIYFFFRVLLHFSSRFSCFSCSNHIQISFHSIFWIHRLDVFFIFITKNTSANRVLFLQFCKCL